MNGTLFFTTAIRTENRELSRKLWQYDGADTKLVKEFIGSRSNFRMHLVNVNNTLFFTPDEKLHGIELWQYDGVNTTLVKDIAVGSKGSHPWDLTNVNGILYFAANDGVHGAELWQHDLLFRSQSYAIAPRRPLRVGVILRASASLAPVRQWPETLHRGLPREL